MKIDGSYLPWVVLGWLAIDCAGAFSWMLYGTWPLVEVFSDTTSASRNHQAIMLPALAFGCWAMAGLCTRRWAGCFLGMAISAVPAIGSLWALDVVTWTMTDAQRPLDSWAGLKILPAYAFLWTAWWCRSDRIASGIAWFGFFWSLLGPLQRRLCNAFPDGSICDVMLGGNWSVALTSMLLASIALFAMVIARKYLT